MTASLFPAFVRQVTTALGSNQPGGLSLEATPGELVAYGSELARMRTTRRAEFLVGRRCAQAAISACAPELDDAVAIAVGERRAPVWPVGLVGAITHTSRVVSAAVARVRDARGIGLDVEERMKLATAREVLPSIAAVAEVDLVCEALRIDEAAGLTLVFSAKESAYKCLYPLARRYFDYREAEVVQVDAAASRCAVRVAVDLGDAGPAGTRLDVAFAVDADRVWTGCWLLPA